MRVAVIGGGLTGRVAAWAVMQAGHAPHIYDRMYDKIAKTPRGFVYIHDAMMLPLKAKPITVVRQGNSREYAEKVYGSLVKPEDTSFDHFGGSYIGYDPAELLGWLNGLQHEMVRDANFDTWEEIQETIIPNYEKIIFTLPLNKFFKGNYPHVKGSSGAWKLNEGEDLSNACVYNSSSEIPWYRAGAMFGWAFREFPYVIPGNFPIIKVVNGDKPPEIENVLFTGRYGKWDKKTLSHESFYETIEWLK